jgi:hypothetical protein
MILGSDDGEFLGTSLVGRVSFGETDSHRLVGCRSSGHVFSMPTETGSATQFSLFDRSLEEDGRQPSRPKRRARLPDLMQAVGQLGDEELADLIRVAVGEARRRGVSLGHEGEEKEGTTPSAEKPTIRASAPPKRGTPPTPEIPLGKLNLIRAALQAGFSPARVAKDFGVSTATVRKLRAP